MSPAKHVSERSETKYFKSRLGVEIKQFFNKQASRVPRLVESGLFVSSSLRHWQAHLYHGGEPMKNKSALYRYALYRRHLKKTNEPLVELLTRFERPCLIYVAPKNPYSFEIAHMERGQVVSRMAVMNYGYIWGRHTTYIFNESNNVWYEICNKTPNQRTVRVRETPFTFGEADKVQDIYFYDGTVENVLNELGDAGWKIGHCSPLCDNN